MNPRALIIVAYLFIASGIFALVVYLGDLVFSEHVRFNPKILDFWIGRWLLEREPRGYRLAVFFSGVAMILSPVILVFFAMIGTLPTWRFVGVDIAQPSWPVYASLILASAGLNACQYHVLRRPHIRALFPDPAESSARPT